MTQEQIIEGNKLLAEFMGYEHNELEDDDVTITYNCYDHLENISGKKPWESTIDDYASWLRPDEMKFHSDWNWLMSVVDKIEDLRCKDIEDNEIQWFVVIGEGADCRIYHDYSDVDEIIVYGAESKIVAAWQAIVEFVRSYLKGENESSTN